MKWLVYAIFIIVAYASSTVFSSFNTPTLCADCHSAEYKSYLMPDNLDLYVHKETPVMPFPTRHKRKSW